MGLYNVGWMNCWNIEESESEYLVKFPIVSYCIIYHCFDGLSRLSRP